MSEKRKKAVQLASAKWSGGDPVSSSEIIDAIREMCAEDAREAVKEALGKDQEVSSLVGPTDCEEFGGERGKHLGVGKDNNDWCPNDPAGQGESVADIEAEFRKKWKGVTAEFYLVPEGVAIWVHAKLRQAREEEQAKAYERWVARNTALALEHQRVIAAERATADRRVAEEREKVNAEIAKEWVELIELVTNLPFPPAENRVIAASEALAQWRDEAVRKARVEAQIELLEWFVSDSWCTPVGIRKGEQEIERLRLVRLSRSESVAEKAVSAKCEECGGTGETEDDATGALGYVVKKPCPRGCSKPAPTSEAPVTICDTPGCGRAIPPGGEGAPEICPTCLACLEFHDSVPKNVVEKRVAEAKARALGEAWNKTAEVLGLRDGESCLAAARRVVAERDTAIARVSELRDSNEALRKDLAEALDPHREQTWAERFRVLTDRAETAERERDEAKRTKSVLEAELSSSRAARNTLEDRCARYEKENLDLRAELANARNLLPQSYQGKVYAVHKTTSPNPERPLCVFGSRDEALKWAWSKYAVIGSEGRSKTWPPEIEIREEKP